MKLKSIRSRLMILMICVTVLPVLTVTWIATKNTRTSIKKEIMNANASRLQWASQYLNEFDEQIKTLFYTIQIDKKLMAYLSQIGDSNMEIDYEMQDYVDKKMDSIFYSNSSKVDKITLYNHNNHKVISVNFSPRIISDLDIYHSNWKRLLKGPINLYYKRSDNGISAYHGINRFEDRILLGGISVLINKNIWSKVTDIMESTSESSIILLNGQKQILFNSLSQEINYEIKDEINNLNLKNNTLSFIKTKTYYLWARKTDDNKLILLKVLPKSVVDRSAYPTIKAGFITGIIFSIFALILSIILSLKISQPVIKLARTMNRTEIQNFEAKSVESNDEFGMLERDFNSLMKSIKKLIEDKYHKEIELKSAQLKALQAQINPHFLNNTLQYIGGLALSRNIPEIYHIIRVIGDLFRYSISSRGDMVTLEEELKHTKNYLYIQEQRFGERCNVKIDVDRELLASKLPKFSLQPIVENAFEYGLQSQEGIWEMEIIIAKVKKRVLIMVTDNGSGFTSERLKKVRKSLKGDSWVNAEKEELVEPGKSGGIGLRNVNNRFKLHFGEKYGIKIFSKFGGGSLVVMSFPVDEGDKEE